MGYAKRVLTSRGRGNCGSCRRNVRKHRVKRRSKERRAMKYWAAMAEEHRAGIGCYCNAPEWYCVGELAEMFVQTEEPRL